MSYFTSDHLKISNIIIDFEENLLLISGFNKSLAAISNLDDFNNLKSQLNEQLINIENETNILINTLKIIQYNIRQLYDDFAKMKCNNDELNTKLNAKINDNFILLNKNKEIEKIINYKNQIIEEQNKHILELVKFKKNNENTIKELKDKLNNKNVQDLIKNERKTDFPNKNRTINNDKIIQYKNFLNMKYNINKNYKNNFSNLTEENNKMTIKNKIIINYKKNYPEKPFPKTKNVSTIDNEKYIFRDELEQNDEDNKDNYIKSKTTINNSTSTINNKQDLTNNDNIKENKKCNSNYEIIHENMKDKILNENNKKNVEKNIKKLKRKGHSVKNIHKIKNKNFEFDISNNKLTRYFLFNLQREKILSNKNIIKFIREKTPKYKI